MSDREGREVEAEKGPRDEEHMVALQRIWGGPRPGQWLGSPGSCNKHHTRPPGLQPKHLAGTWHQTEKPLEKRVLKIFNVHYEWKLLKCS